jgi:hypothetical protein
VATVQSPEVSFLYPKRMLFSSECFDGQNESPSGDLISPMPKALIEYFWENLKDLENVDTGIDIITSFAPAIQEKFTRLRPRQKRLILVELYKRKQNLGNLNSLKIQSANSKSDLQIESQGTTLARKENFKQKYLRSRTLANVYRNPTIDFFEKFNEKSLPIDNRKILREVSKDSLDSQATPDTSQQYSTEDLHPGDFAGDQLPTNEIFNDADSKENSDFNIEEIRLKIPAKKNSGKKGNHYLVPCYEGDNKEIGKPYEQVSLDITNYLSKQVSNHLESISYQNWENKEIMRRLLSDKKKSSNAKAVLGMAHERNLVSLCERKLQRMADNQERADGIISEICSENSDDRRENRKFGKNLIKKSLDFRKLKMGISKGGLKLSGMVLNANPGEVSDRRPGEVSNRRPGEVSHRKTQSESINYSEQGLMQIFGSRGSNSGLQKSVTPKIAGDLTQRNSDRLERRETPSLIIKNEIINRDSLLECITLKTGKSKEKIRFLGPSPKAVNLSDRMKGKRSSLAKVEKVPKSNRDNNRLAKGARVEKSKNDKSIDSIESQTGKNRSPRDLTKNKSFSKFGLAVDSPWRLDEIFVPNSGKNRCSQTHNGCAKLRHNNILHPRDIHGISEKISKGFDKRTRYDRVETLSSMNQIKRSPEPNKLPAQPESAVKRKTSTHKGNNFRNRSPRDATLHNPTNSQQAPGWKSSETSNIDLDQNAIIAGPGSELSIDINAITPKHLQRNPTCPKISTRKFGSQNIFTTPTFKGNFGSSVKGLPMQSAEKKIQTGKNASAILGVL